MNTREKAWKCWIEIVEHLTKSKVSVDHLGNLSLGFGCGGDFVNIIERYL